MKTYVISECGINHQGDLQTAKDLIYASKECGCSAVKFQTYTAEKRVEKNSPIFDLLKRCELDYEQQTELKEYADQVGIEFFSTPFDVGALKFLVKDLKVSKIKVASFDVTNLGFLKEMENLYNDEYFDVIMSVGMSNEEEIERAIDTLGGIQFGDYFSLLHCVSSYPTQPNEVNLGAIKNLKWKFYPEIVGYSDHTSRIEVPALSVVAGAEMIEKHFTLDLNNGAPDNPVSADPKMMKEMIKKIKHYEEMVGDGEIKMEEAEKGTAQFRRFS